MITPADPTPPSAPAAQWRRRIESQLHALRRDHDKLYKSHEALRSKVSADAMASIHLLAGVADSVDQLAAEVAKVKRQVFGAIKELRAKK